MATSPDSASSLQAPVGAYLTTGRHYSAAPPSGAYQAAMEPQWVVEDYHWDAQELQATQRARAPSSEANCQVRALSRLPARPQGM